MVLLRLLYLLPVSPALLLIFLPPATKVKVHSCISGFLITIMLTLQLAIPDPIGLKLIIHSCWLTKGVFQFTAAEPGKPAHQEHTQDCFQLY